MATKLVAHRLFDTAPLDMPPINVLIWRLMEFRLKAPMTLRPRKKLRAFEWKGTFRNPELGTFVLISDEQKVLRMMHALNESNCRMS